MKHSQYEELLILSFYDELSDQEKSLLSEHVAACERCQKERSELQSLHGTLALRRLAFSQDSMLQSARRELRLRVHEERTSRSVWDRFVDVMDDYVHPRVQIALGAVFAITLGFFLGYAFFVSGSDTSVVRNGFSTASSLEAGEPQVTNFQFVNRNMATGEVEFSFETVTPVHIRGNVNDEQVQKVLARAMIGDQNAGTRLKAVNMLGDQMDSRPSGRRVLDANIKEALISAMLHDKNIGVRKQALQVLQKYLPDQAITRALLTVLTNEKNIGIKIAAINSLDYTKSGDRSINDEITALLKNKAQSDENNYIRIKAKAALQEVQQ